MVWVPNDREHWCQLLPSRTTEGCCSVVTTCFRKGKSYDDAIGLVSTLSMVGTVLLPVHLRIFAASPQTSDVLWPCEARTSNCHRLFQEGSGFSYAAHYFMGAAILMLDGSKKSWPEVRSC